MGTAVVSAYEAFRVQRLTRALRVINASIDANAASVAAACLTGM